VRYGGAVIAAVALFAVLAAAGGEAQSVCQSGFTSQIFTFTGSEQQFVVPAGVTSITAHAWGAQGAAGANGGTGAIGGAGGLGGYATGARSVTPGETLYVNVGGQGNAFNGAGTGGTANAGNGGGASDVRAGGTALANRVLTAGGGGGGGRAGCELNFAHGGAGGAGGGGAGGNGVDAPTPNSGPSGVAGGGKGGTLGAGGAAGTGCSGFLGQPGTVPNGGAGQGCCCFGTATPHGPGGGGGGGGFVQGGGGGGGSAGTTTCSGNDKGGGGGGAGGSSDTGGVTGGSTSNGVRTGNGEIVLCYTTPSPADVNGSKTVSGTFSPGSTATYTVVLSNAVATPQLDNPGDEFTDVLPPGVALVAAVATSGTAVASTGTNTVTWNGSIPGYGSVTITITATVAAGNHGTVVSNQGSIAYDADGDGTNEAVRFTDDPGQSGVTDPTVFQLVGVQIPAVSAAGRWLLIVLLGALAILLARRLA